MYQDKTLKCRDCGAGFRVHRFRAGCSSPRRASRTSPAVAPLAAPPAATRNGGNNGPRQMYEVICDGCGCTTQVPFQPRGDRPVYCRDCFEAHRQSRY